MSSRGDLEYKTPFPGYACTFDVRSSSHAPRFNLELTDDPYSVPTRPKIIHATTQPLSQAAQDAERVELERWEKINQAKTQTVKSAAKLAILCGAKLFGIMTLNASVDFQWLGFLGKYGPQVDPVIKRIYQAAVPERHLAKIYSDQDIAEILQKQGNLSVTSADIQAYRDTAIERDLTKGPTWNEVAYTSSDVPESSELKDCAPEPATFNLLDELCSLGVSEDKLKKLETFLNNFGHNRFIPLQTSSRLNAKDGMQFGMKFELSLMNIQKAHMMPAPHITERQLVEGQGSAGPKKALFKFMFGPEVQAAMTEPDCATRFIPDKLKKALREEIDVSVLRRKDTIGKDGTLIKGASATPEELDFFFEDPDMMRVWFGLHHSSKIDAILRVVKMWEMSVAKLMLLEDIGTREQCAKRLAEELFDGGITGLIGTQECSKEMAAALRTRGFATTTQDLDADEKIGTTSFYDTKRFTLAEIIPHGYRDPEGRGWKLQTALVQLLAIERFMVFFANLHGDAAKPGDKKKLDGIVKYEEAVTQHRNTQNFSRYSAKHIGFVCTGDFNIKSDAELQALTDSVATAGHMVIEIGPTTGKCLVYSFQDLKVGQFRGGSGDLVIIDTLFFQAILSQVAGQNIQRNWLMPNKEEHWIDHRSAGLIVVVNEAAFAQAEESTETTVTPQDKQVSSSASMPTLEVINKEEEEKPTDATQATQATQAPALLEEPPGRASTPWIDDLLEENFGDLPEQLLPLVNPDQNGYLDQNGFPSLDSEEDFPEDAHFAYLSARAQTPGEEGVGDIPETTTVTMHTATQANAIEEDQAGQEEVGRSEPINIPGTATDPTNPPNPELYETF